MRGKCPKCGHSKPRKRPEGSRLNKRLRKMILSVRRAIKTEAKDLPKRIIDMAALVEKLENAPRPAPQRTRDMNIAEAKELIQQAKG